MIRFPSAGTVSHKVNLILNALLYFEGERMFRCRRVQIVPIREKVRSEVPALRIVCCHSCHLHSLVLYRLVSDTRRIGRDAVLCGGALRKPRTELDSMMLVVNAFCLCDHRNINLRVLASWHGMHSTAQFCRLLSPPSAAGTM